MDKQIRKIMGKSKSAWELGRSSMIRELCKEVWKEAQKEIIKKIEHSMSVNYQSYNEMKLDGIDLKVIKDKLDKEV